MNESLVLQALKLMVIGMGTVFLFLSLMIFLLNLQAKIVTKYFLKTGFQNPNLKQSKEVKKLKNKEEKIDLEVVAVITAAVKRFRAKKAQNG